MLLITTTKCHDYGHPELALALDSTSLEADARWFAGVLEQMVQSGSRFQPGQSLQIGWSVVWFVARANKTLGFEEPDMKSIPLVRQPGLTNSLRHLRLHKDTLESVLCSDALSLPSLQQSCLICTRLARLGSFFMDRRQPQRADSGWFVGCQADEHDHNDPTTLRTVSLYEAVVVICPRALPYLAFPPGATIAVGDALSFFMNGEPLEIRKGSFVDAQHRQPQRGHSV
jgi:hypothetical protein